MSSNSVLKMFGKAVFGIGKAVVELGLEAIDSQNQKVDNCVEQYKSLSDSRLLDIMSDVKSLGPEQHKFKAASIVLKNRGYTSNQIMERINKG